ncbi:transposase [Acinetobacter brisouii]
MKQLQNEAVSCLGHKEQSRLSIDIKITRNEVYDSQVVAQLICEISQADYLIADKGYDSEKLEYWQKSKILCRSSQ